VLHIEINQQENKTIELINHLGQIVLQETGIGALQLNTSGLAEGMYLLTIDGLVYKIIKR
jgi:hypothetical protein